MLCALYPCFYATKSIHADNEHRFKAKERRPRRAGTSRRLHPFFGACELAALCASSDKRTLLPEKRILRSAGRRGGAVASNICDGLGSLKFNLSRFSKKPHGRTPSGFVFLGCLILQRQPENLNGGLGDEPSPFHCGRVSGSLKRLFGLRFELRFRLPYYLAVPALKSRRR